MADVIVDIDGDEPYKVIIDVVLVLDRSISMKPAWPQTISGLNEYFQSLRVQENEELEYRITMFNFYGKVEKMYDRVTLDTIPTFREDRIKADQYGTALYDAVGEALSLPEVTNPALVVIITDGEENSSRKFYQYDVQKMITSKKALGNYTFVYLGASEEAWGASTTFSAPGNTTRGTVASRADDFHNLTRSMMSYTSSMNANSRMYRSISGTTVNSADTGLTRGVTLSTETFYDQPTTTTTPTDAEVMAQVLLNITGEESGR